MTNAGEVMTKIEEVLTKKNQEKGAYSDGDLEFFLERLRKYKECLVAYNYFFVFVEILRRNFVQTKQFLGRQ